MRRRTRRDDRGPGHDIRVLADEDGPVRNRPRRRRAGKKAQRQIAGFAGRERGRAVIRRRQVQDEDRTGQFVDEYGGLGPDVAAALGRGFRRTRIGVALARVAVARVVAEAVRACSWKIRHRRQIPVPGSIPGAARHAASANVATARPSSSAWASPSAIAANRDRGMRRGQAFEDGRDLFAEPFAVGRRPSGEPAQQTLPGNVCQQGAQRRMSWSREHPSPLQLPLALDGPAIDDRTVEPLERVSQGPGDAGPDEGGIDRPQVDRHGRRRSGGPAEQGGEYCMLGLVQPADPDRAGRAALDDPAQTPPQGRPRLAAEQTLEPGIGWHRVRSACGRH